MTTPNPPTPTKSTTIPADWLTTLKMLSALAHQSATAPNTIKNLIANLAKRAEKFDGDNIPFPSDDLGITPQALIDRVRIKMQVVRLPDPERKIESVAQVMDELEALARRD